MKKIKMLNLLKEVIKYDFFEWEPEDSGGNSIRIGMSNNLLNKLKFPNFYNSMGFDVVDNPYAQPSLSSKEWLKCIVQNEST